MSVNFSAFNTNNMLSSVVTAIDSLAPVRASPVAVPAASRQQQQQKPIQLQHPVTTTKMGSRRIFSAQFKLQVLDSYREDSDCKGNQRATARKYGIHRRQIQKWLQGESNLRSSIIVNNNNNNSNSSSGSSNAMQNSSGKMATSNGGAMKRLHENGNVTKSVNSQNAAANISLSENNISMDASNGFITFNKEPHGDRAPVAVSFASAMPAIPAPHALDSSSAISPAFTPYMRRPIEFTSAGGHLPMIPAAAYDSVFNHHHHHQHPSAAAAAYPFFNYHHHIYPGIPAYRALPTAPVPIQPQDIVPLTIQPVSTADIQGIKTEPSPHTTNSPIDLSQPVLRQSNTPGRIAKPRAFLPLSMASDGIRHINIEKGNSGSSGSAASGASASASAIGEQKPWDLSRKRPHLGDSDVDEGISVHVSVKTSSSPVKVAKLFKPYLMSSDDEDDDEDDDAGKKCLPSDASTTNRASPKTQASFYDSKPVTVQHFHPRPAELVSTPATTSSTVTMTSASYWLNHGSPVSGYDSASSTFSACDDIDDRNCDLPTKSGVDTATVAAAVANAATTAVATTATKYMGLRRHMLEKWTHEEDDAYLQQYMNYM